MSVVEMHEAKEKHASEWIFIRFYFQKLNRTQRGMLTPTEDYNTEHLNFLFVYSFFFFFLNFFYSQELENKNQRV